VRDGDHLVLAEGQRPGVGMTQSKRHQPS
jgi:hypothetical protein